MHDPRQQDLEVLFHQAADLRGADQEAFLNEHCSHDAALRKELVALLRQHGQATMGYLEQQILDPDTVSELLVTDTPDSIGRYHILETIGEGGMGTVYRAEQREPVCRNVALKVIKAGMDTHRVVKRFETERQTLALMDHPGIARIYDAGATDMGRPYFVMELVAGSPLTSFCDEHRLPIGERLQLFQRVCEAIQHAHHKGVIHRDLKPSNILVAVQDGEPRPKIIDFGIARATADASVAQHTHHGEIIGTLDYMSPEQAEPGQARVDSRSDIYALGAILYELLTGARPLGEDSLHEKALADVQRILRDKEVAAPSTQISRLQSRAAEELATIVRARNSDISAIRRQLQGDLDWIVLKALDKDPARRYASASELAADLQRHLGHEPVLASPPSQAYRLAKFVRRNRLAVTAVVLVIVALAVGGTGTALGYTEARANESRALESEGEAKESARQARASERRAKDEAAEAIRQRRVAQEHLDNFNLLALGVKVKRVTAAAELLRPPWPETVDAMRDWLRAQAEPLVAQLPDLRQRLTALQARGDDYTDEQKQLDRRTHPAAAILARIEAEFQKTHETLDNARTTPERRERALAAIEAVRKREEPTRQAMVSRIEMRRTCRMLDESEQFLHDALVRLILDLEGFGVEPTGAVAEVRHDLQWAQRVGHETLVEPKRQWAEAREAIEASEKYGGLDLAPQVGLIPLGVNPDTGFWEFLHLRSHRAGTPRPRLDDDGVLIRPGQWAGMVFVLLPGGEFAMGAQKNDTQGANYDAKAVREDGPVRTVRLDPFFLSKFEMTQAQWSELAGNEQPSNFRAGTARQENLPDKPGLFYDFGYPVDRVSWVEARHDLNRFGLELPTEAQWEYACRGGTRTRWYTGTSKSSLRGHANLADRRAARNYPNWRFERELDDGYVGPARVGSFRPNPFGLYDMFGNIQEWCLDSSTRLGGARRDGDGYRAAAPGRPYRPILRGGSYGSMASVARSATRAAAAMNAKRSYNGVRPVRMIRGTGER